VAGDRATERVASARRKNDARNILSPEMNYAVNERAVLKEWKDLRDFKRRLASYTCTADTEE